MRDDFPEPDDVRVPEVPYGVLVLVGVLVGVLVLVDGVDPVELLEPVPLLLSTVTLDTFQVDPCKVRSVTIRSSSADGDFILSLMYVWSTTEYTVALVPLIDCTYWLRI